MSDLLASITEIVTKTVIGTGSSRNHNGSQELSLISTTSLKKGIRQCLSQQEADKYIENHLKYVQWYLSNINIPESEVCYLLQQCLICQCYGHDVSFAGIYAIQQAQSAQLWGNKYLSYNACIGILKNKSDLVILMVSTIQRDLKSSNTDCIQLALSAASSLMTPELIPALENIVCERIRHPDTLVRRKAAACLGAFMVKMPELLESRLPVIKTLLLDKDMITVSTALQVLCSLDVSLFQSDRLELIKLITEKIAIYLHSKSSKHLPGFSRGLDYVIVKGLKLLGKLCTVQEQPMHQKTLVTVLSVLDAYDKDTHLGSVSVVSECCNILPIFTNNSGYMDRIACIASNLLKHPVSNFKATGLKIMKSLVKNNSLLIQPFQHLIITELKSPDTVISDMALEMVMSLTNASNVKQIYEIFKRCSNPSGNMLQHQILGIRILTHCEANTLDPEWFLQKLVDILSIGPLSHGNLDVLLSYFSENNFSIEFHQNLLLKLKEVPSLNLLICILWLHNQAVDFSIDDLPDIVLTVVNSSTQTGNMVYLLALLQEAAFKDNSKLFTSKQYDSLEKRMKVLNLTALSYPYMQAIKTNTKKQQLDNCDVKLSECLWDSMASYEEKCVKDGVCRQKGKQDCQKTPIQALKFTTQSDMSQSLTPEVPSKTTKNVWTSKGRVANHAEVDKQVVVSAPSAPASSSDSEMNVLLDSVFKTV